MKIKEYMIDLMWPAKPKISDPLKERFADSALYQTFLKFAFYS